MKLTVFTPCYNRAHCLSRLYNSLISQTVHDFEWLIVDDGSTDGTDKTVRTFSEELFPIRYIYKSNGGKHTAYNTALEHAAGELFLCVDSDDMLTPDAVERIVSCPVLPNSSAGFIAYKSLFDGTILSTEFPHGVSYTKLCELNYKYAFSGELSIIFKTDIAKSFPFPVFENERFVGESVVYDRIDGLYDYHLLPYTITVCEYQPDGYSASVDKLIKNNPTGYCLYYMQRIDIVPSLKSRIVTAGKYHAFRIFSKKRLTYSGERKMLIMFTAPLGRLFWLYYKLFRGF